MVVWSKIFPIAALGVAILFVANAFQRPAAATSTARALTEQVATIGAAGQNIEVFGRGVGGGLAGLLQPIWEVSNLIERFSTLSSGAANVSPVSQELGGYASYPSSPTYTTSSGTNQPTPTPTPSTSTITWSSGQTATVPTLSAAAKSFYKNLGVGVS
jgi:hypothetical protein